MINFLFLDADDTLLDFSWAEDQAIHRTYRELGAEMTDEMYARYHTVNQSYWRTYERGEITREALLVARHRQMFEEYGLDCDPVQCENLYRKNLGIGHHFIPHAVEILDYLRPRCRLFLASNGVAETQNSRLESAGIGPCFEQIFISEEAGASKPSVEYFDYVFSRIPDAAQENCLLVGDSVSSDMRGANNYGLACCWYNPQGLAAPDGLRIDYEIQDLRQLLSIVNE